MAATEELQPLTGAAKIFGTLALGYGVFFGNVVVLLDCSVAWPS